MSVTSQPLSNEATAKRVLIAGCGDLGLRVPSDYLLNILTTNPGGSGAILLLRIRPCRAALNGLRLTWRKQIR